MSMLKGSSILQAAGLSFAALAMIGGTAVAADLPSSVVPPAPPAPLFTGPFAPIFAPLAAQGISFRFSAIDFFGDNPSIGLVRGRGSNDAYITEGVDIDLGKLAGLNGTSLHYTNNFFAGVLNLNAAPQIGDAQIGYPPPYTPEVAALRKATIEQKIGGLDIELGITHPGDYLAKFNTPTWNTVFNDILFLESGYGAFNEGVPGANVNYAITPFLYVDAGVFATSPTIAKYNAYDFADAHYRGVLAAAEIGSQTSLATDPYAYKIALTGLYNSAPHTGYGNIGTFTQTGSSSIVFQAEKVVWHPAGSPTNIRVYGTYAASLDSTQPIQSDAWIGADISAPFLSRPADFYGVKLYWEKTNSGFTNFENFNLAPGQGLYNSNAFTFEAHAHFALPLGANFEPVVNYTINPNNYWNGGGSFPATRVHAGAYLGGTVFVPLGVILGIQAPS